MKMDCERKQLFSKVMDIRQCCRQQGSWAGKQKIEIINDALCCYVSPKRYYRHLFRALMVPIMFPVKLNGNEMGQSFSSEKIGKYIRAVFI